MIYSFDPGKITGVAVGDSHGKLHDSLQLDENDLFDYLVNLRQADLFIVENFLIRPNKASSFAWSDMQTIQIIGALKYKARELGVQFILQEPNIKPIGYRWAGLKPPKSHIISHAQDAYVHLVYYWVKRLGLQPPSIKRIIDEQNREAKDSGNAGDRNTL